MFDLNRLAPSTSNVVTEGAISLNESFANSDRHDHSYVNEALEFLTNLDNEMLEANIVFYGALCESEGNDMLITESFSDWMDTFKKIIKKVVDFLKALLNKFLVGINMLIKREKYLKDHKKDFNKFNENHKFHMNVFKFTIDDGAGAAVPPMDAIYEALGSKGRLMIKASTGLDSIINNDLYGDNKDSGLKGANSAAAGDLKGVDIDKAYQDYMNTLENGDYYDKVRGLMLGDSSKRIDASDYSKDLFEVFRDGQSGKEDYEFEAADITEAYTRFNSYESIKKDLEKRKKETEKSYEDLSKEVSKLVELGRDGKFKIKGDEYDTGSDSKARKYEYYMKARSNEINEVASIHTIAFSARLDAYKDQFNQDKTILYKALYRILGNIKTGVRED